LRGAIRQLAERALAPIAPLSWHLRRSPRLLVLTYHRVLPAGDHEVAIEQPGMYVSPETLDMHLTLLKRHFGLMHLDEWLRRASAGASLPPQACALTFDDGWRDNFDHAFPVLLGHAAPATIFLVSGMIGTRRQFWPNRLARLLAGLRPGEKIPHPLASLLQTPPLQKLDGEAWNPESIDRAISSMKVLDDAQIDALLDACAASQTSGTDEPSMLDDAQLKSMASSGLVRFGSHTRSHVRCAPHVTREALDEQIVSSYADIVARVPDAAAPVFCYPNGETSEAAVALVRKHYIGAVTTRAGWHSCGADPHLIRRVAVHEDISERAAGFLARVSGWT
jgi:peptidoglycan/xylan/chitin deacetylase (PgdA/CDA1 family)